MQMGCSAISGNRPATSSSKPNWPLSTICRAEIVANSFVCEAKRNTASLGIGFSSPRTFCPTACLYVKLPAQNLSLLTRQLADSNKYTIFVSGIDNHMRHLPILDSLSKVVLEFAHLE